MSYTKTPFIGIALMLLGLLLPAQVLSADVRYVSDKLSVPIRSGASTDYRIVKFVSSGAALTIIEISEDGKYAQVEYATDKTGWVLVDNLMQTPSARVRLKAANNKLEQSQQQASQLKRKIAELKAEIDTLQNENAGLQNERTELSQSLDDFKLTAANPLALAKKNQRLTNEVDRLEAKVNTLRADNEKLGSNVAREWFMIGGGVSIGSLILGLLITRINWRRKRDSWGDSF